MAHSDTGNLISRTFEPSGRRAAAIDELVPAGELGTRTIDEGERERSWASAAVSP